MNEPINTKSTVEGPAARQRNVEPQCSSARAPEAANKSHFNEWTEQPVPLQHNNVSDDRTMIEKWSVAMDSANPLAEPHKTMLLHLCRESMWHFELASAEGSVVVKPHQTLQSLNSFVAKHHRCSPLSPEAYFVKCIRKNPSKAITTPCVGHFCRSRFNEASFIASEATIQKFHARNAVPYNSDMWHAQEAATITTQKASNHRAGNIVWRSKGCTY